MEEFDKIIGLDRLKVLHINDSKNPQGSHKDRHANIGFGTIGFDTLNKIVHDPMFDNISKILETPYVGKDKRKLTHHMEKKSPCSKHKYSIQKCFLSY